MKKKYITLRLAAVAAMIALVFGCVDGLQTDPEEQTAGDKYYLTLQVSKNESITKALLVNDYDNTILTTWDATDKIDVYKEGALVGTLSPKNYQENQTRLDFSGTVNNTVVVGSTLSFFVRKDAELSGQIGTLEAIAGHCDSYASGEYTVHSITNSHIVLFSGSSPAAGVELYPCNTIVKFTLKDSETGAPLNASALTIKYGDQTLSLSSIPADTYTNTNNGAGVVYVALPGVSFTNKAITLTATYKGNDYVFEKTLATNFETKYYRISVGLYSDIVTPLTFEAKVNNATVKFTQGSQTIFDSNGGVQYQTITSGSLGSWTNYTSGTEIKLTTAGDKVRFRGALTHYAANPYEAGNSTYYDNASNFVVKNCYVYGNVMSLISDNLTDNDSFSNKRSLSATYTFAGLFEIRGTETGVLTHPNKNISLPATSLQNSCYRGMFYHCSGLTVAPALPSMSVPALGYFQMFSRTGLVKAPDLPATAIEQQSYAKMFQDCSALTTGPERLPAQKLKTSCYYQMFKGCTSLTTAPILCATTFPDWPTETCYGEMFYGCSHLQSVICYNTTKVSSTNSSDTPNYKTYTENWLYGVNSSGTFYTNNSSKWKTGSPHGIPSGWTTASIPAQ